MLGQSTWGDFRLSWCFHASSNQWPSYIYIDDREWVSLSVLWNSAMIIYNKIEASSIQADISFHYLFPPACILEFQFNSDPHVRKRKLSLSKITKPLLNFVCNFKFIFICVHTSTLPPVNGVHTKRCDTWHPRPSHTVHGKNHGSHSDPGGTERDHQQCLGECPDQFGIASRLRLQHLQLQFIEFLRLRFTTQIHRLVRTRRGHAGFHLEMPISTETCDP